MERDTPQGSLKLCRIEDPLFSRPRGIQDSAKALTPHQMKSKKKMSGDLEPREIVLPSLRKVRADIFLSIFKLRLIYGSAEAETSQTVCQVGHITFVEVQTIIISMCAIPSTGAGLCWYLFLLAKI